MRSGSYFSGGDLKFKDFSPRSSSAILLVYIKAIIEIYSRPNSCENEGLFPPEWEKRLNKCSLEKISFFSLFLAVGETHAKLQWISHQNQTYLRGLPLMFILSG